MLVAASAVSSGDNAILNLLLDSIDLVLLVEVVGHILATSEKLLGLSLTQSDSVLHLGIELLLESLKLLNVGGVQVFL